MWRLSTPQRSLCSRDREPAPHFIERVHSMDFPLTTQLLQIVSQSTCSNQIIQLIPQAEGMVVQDDTQNDTCEIGLSKSHYLRLFKEGHSYFREKPKTEQIDGRGAAGSAFQCSGRFRSFQPQSMAPTELFSCYLATLSMLLTTNEYSSVWTTHEKMVLELQARNLRASDFLASPSKSIVECDFKFMMALATSRLDRINKSPMLWHWIRRLSVITVFSHFDETVFLATLRSTMRSMTLHFANYCACYTFAWMVQMAQMSGCCFEKEPVVSLLRDACRASLGDVSLWTLYAKLLQPPERFGLKLYQDSKLALGAFVPNSPGPCSFDNAPPFFAEEDALEELRWLVAVECEVLSPYMLLVPHLNPEKVSSLKNQSIEKVQNYLEARVLA